MTQKEAMQGRVYAHVRRTQAITPVQAITTGNATAYLSTIGVNAEDRNARTHTVSGFIHSVHRHGKRPCPAVTQQWSTRFFRQPIAAYSVTSAARNAPYRYPSGKISTSIPKLRCSPATPPNPCAPWRPHSLPLHAHRSAAPPAYSFPLHLAPHVPPVPFLSPTPPTTSPATAAAPSRA